MDRERTSTCVPSEGSPTVVATSSAPGPPPPPPPTTPSKPASQTLESILNTSTSSTCTASSSSSSSSSSHPHHLPHQHQHHQQHQPTTTTTASSSDRSISPKPMPTPTTLSEWQLLAVLSKANLVQYYDVFIAQGGDDINQIMACEEREFLEIMSLVGMLAKPLHVRRMQRALTEYSHDRTAFNLAALQQIGPPPPLNYTPAGADPMALLLPGIAAATSPNFPSLRFLSQLSSVAGTSSTSSTPSGDVKTTTTSSSSSASDSAATKTAETSASTSSNSVPLAFKFAAPLLDHLAADPFEPSVSGPSSGASSGGGGAGAGAATANVFTGNSIGLNFGAPGGVARHLHHHAHPSTSSATSSSAAAGPSTSTCPPFLPFSARPGGSSTSAAGQEKEGSASPFLVSGIGIGGSGGGGGAGQPYGNDFVSLGDFDPNNPSSTENPTLSPAQVARLAECALAASKNLPHLPPRLVQNKKRVSKEVYDLLKTTPGNPGSINDFRRFSAIYGRFDTKRKPHKVLTLHETSVNEAAAQLCVLVPSLLTRRDELFPLSRQVVKDAGYNYAKSRKRPCDPADLHSPLSSPSQSPPPPQEQEFYEQPGSSTSIGGSSGASGSGGGLFRDEERPIPIPPEGWAALIEQMKDETPDT